MKSEVSYTRGMHFSRGRLRGHRNGLGLSQVELGARAGIDPDTLAAFEQGDLAPGDATVFALAEALGVPVRSLRSITGNWCEDYVDAALSHAEPLATQDVDRAAHALRGAHRA